MNTTTRTIAAGLLATSLQAGLPAQAAQSNVLTQIAAQATVDGNYVVTADGVRLYYKDWGPKDGPVVTLSHGWPLSSDSWESQMIFLADKGYRVIAHDRRGHGRSSQPWDGNDMDHYADDLAAVISALDVKDVTAVGFSTGGGEVARYIGRHGTSRVRKAVLVSAVPPLMLQTADNPGGLPIEVFDGLRQGSLENRSQLYIDIASGPFYGFNRPDAKVSQGLIDSWWAQGMQAGHKNTYDSIAAFSATDFRQDLKKFDVPTLVIHGDDDQIVPLDISGKASAAQIAGAKLIVYPGAPHGLTETHKERFNQDLLNFLED
ncbi:alpha/beta fold hydrolase [Pollutimonas harenae]|uniref:Alpha/beta hydrolase n=1 Tax=Pollutimonas harenae TaxID=657015 RepID=A0A853GXF7_9BURK|nr:alpha/beta hydrolase [Pollutimonas harenae]NYT84019.1 alpha/beta hydrolase [Pollutimonas harenae]TEA73555.1 alpha/beta hydrolase [Pollutimonas harenae]